VLLWDQEAIQARQVLLWDQEAIQARQVHGWDQDRCWFGGKNVLHDQAAKFFGQGSVNNVMRELNDRVIPVK
jgi:hypothetical protein